MMRQKLMSPKARAGSEPPNERAGMEDRGQGVERREREEKKVGRVWNPSILEEGLTKAR